MYYTVKLISVRITDEQFRWLCSLGSERSGVIRMALDVLHERVYHTDSVDPHATDDAPDDGGELRPPPPQVPPSSASGEPDA